MLRNISRSLADLLGSEYMQAVKAAAVEINGRGIDWSHSCERGQFD